MAPRNETLEEILALRGEQSSTSGGGALSKEVIISLAVTLSLLFALSIAVVAVVLRLKMQKHKFIPPRDSRRRTGRTGSSGKMHSEELHSVVPLEGSSGTRQHHAPRPSVGNNLNSFNSNSTDKEKWNRSSRSCRRRTPAVSLRTAGTLPRATRRHQSMGGCAEHSAAKAAFAASAVTTRRFRSADCAD